MSKVSPAAWLPLALNPPFTSADPALLYPTEYRLHPDGSVELRGAILTGASQPVLLFTLPAEASPARAVTLQALMKTAGGSPTFSSFAIDVADDGLGSRSFSVLMGSGDRIYIDGLRFPTIL